MLKEKMQVAKELIQQKQYPEARTLLRGIDHSTAKEWLRKLDAMPTVKQPARTKNSIINFVIVGVLAGVTGLAIGFFMGNSTGRQSQPQLAAMPTNVSTALPTNVTIALLPVSSSPLPSTRTVTSEVIRAPLGAVTVPGNAYMDGIDYESNDLTPMDEINIWDTVPRQRVVCSLKHADAVDLLEVKYVGDEERYYFRVSKGACTGWVSDPFVNPKMP
jgi:hypothetical protein